MSFTDNLKKSLGFEEDNFGSAYGVGDYGEDIGFIDDDRYARIFVEEEIRHQKGPNAIKHVLLTKGIDEIIINKYLENYSNELLFENALDMGNKTLKTVIGLPIQKQKEYFTSILFCYTIIKS